MIYITGDTHAEFNRFSTDRFPEQKEMTRNDFVIICGDFGGVWDFQESSNREIYWLNWLAGKPFTILFVDGNHENFDRLKEFPVVDYHGGKAHKIRDNIYHLMRGYVFEFEHKKFFTFGGASSHDVQDGILDEKNYDSLLEMVRDYNRRTKAGQMLRINHISWWKNELPESYEMMRGIKNLEKVDFKVDYVISHCLPQSVCSYLGYSGSDKLTKYFDSLLFDYHLTFGKWYCGHYHREDRAISQYILKYKNIERIL